MSSRFLDVCQVLSSVILGISTMVCLLSLGTEGARTADVGAIKRHVVGFTHRILLFKGPTEAACLTSSLISSGNSVSDVDNRRFLCAQYTGGVRPWAQFSVSSPAP